MSTKFTRISFSYMPRSKNQFADALAKLASMVSIPEGVDIQPLEIEVRDEPAYCLVLEGAQEAEIPWFQDIKNFLNNRDFPEGANSTEKRTIQRLAGQFLLSGGQLYKRSYNNVLLRCVTKVEAERLIEIVHGGICGPHMNGHMLARKILRLGYYWSTMERDCCIHVKRCYSCQIYADNKHAPL